MFYGTHVVDIELYSSSVSALSIVRVDLESFPGTLGVRLEYTMNGLPIQATMDTHTLHTHSHLRQYSIASPTVRSLEGGRKLNNLEKSHESKQESWTCEAAMLYQVITTHINVPNH